MPRRPANRISLGGLSALRIRQHESWHQRERRVAAFHSLYQDTDRRLIACRMNRQDRDPSVGTKCFQHKIQAIRSPDQSERAAWAQKPARRLEPASK